MYTFLLWNLRKLCYYFNSQQVEWCPNENWKKNKPSEKIYQTFGPVSFKSYQIDRILTRHCLSDWHKVALCVKISIWFSSTLQNFQIGFHFQPAFINLNCNHTEQKRHRFKATFVIYPILRSSKCEFRLKTCTEAMF